MTTENSILAWLHRIVTKVTNVENIGMVYRRALKDGEVSRYPATTILYKALK